jgi:hypothetical protein
MNNSNPYDWYTEFYARKITSWDKFIIMPILTIILVVIGVGVVLPVLHVVIPRPGAHVQGLSPPYWHKLNIISLSY